MTQQVSDLGSNANENIAHAAKVIGRSAQRRKVFNAIYTSQRKVKNVAHLMRATKLDQKAVLRAAKALVDNQIAKVHPTKIDGQTAYEKIGFFQSHKAKILRFVDQPSKLAEYPTKRNPVSSGGRTVTVKLRSGNADARLLTVDDIASFSKVRKIAAGVEETGDRYSEEDFKRGLQKILGETGKFVDWGGEVADLYTTNFQIKGSKRRATAVALKGPATKGRLTPGKLGKNGDKIQRMFGAAAEVFLIQYCRQIDLSVLGQMKTMAITKSLMDGGKAIYYGVIDGQDSARLVAAYPEAFSSSKKTGSKKTGSKKTGSKKTAASARGR